jgi:acyl-CoA:6-aminopenicillanic acid acyl transferase
MPIDYQSFDLAGPHYDLGFVQGARTERFEIPPWWPAPPDLAFAEDCARQIAEVHLPLLDELRGYADGQRLSYEELLRGVCRRSMRLRARVPAVYPEGGCSSFATIDADRHVRVGRNYDFHPVQRVRQRLRLKPERGRPSVGMRGSVPGGRYDGVNDAGVFICLHVALSDEPEEIRPGIPFHLLPRLVLETCTTAREAVDLLTRVRHLHPFNYLVADARGDLFVVEAHPARVRVLDPELERPERNAKNRDEVEGRAYALHASSTALRSAQSACSTEDEQLPHNFIAATNHYRHPDMIPFQHGRKLTHSQDRLAFLYENAGRRTSTSLLTHHASRVCGHSGGHTTLWSLTADLTAHTLAYAPGAPCVTPYEPVPWPD